MTIRNLISEIAAEWPNYKELGKVNKTAQAHKLVVNEFPKELKRIALNTDYLLFHGSTGAGNVTAAPCIACFDSRITTSATSGYYVVYLFSIDLKRIFLEFGFGTTQFKNHFKKKAECYERIRTAAKMLQEGHEKKLLPLFKQALYDNISREPIDLATTKKHNLHEAYEQSSIYSIEYSLSNLPSADHLESDFNSFLELYRAVTDDPLTSNMEELFEWALEPIRDSDKSTITSFKIRPEKKKKRSLLSKSTSRRRSKESLKVGNAGEIAVLNYEKNKLKSAGLTNLESKVVHESAEGNTPGWDITSFNEKGEEIFIEVKSSTGKTITSVDITDNEWKAASKFREKYYLYLVTNALASTCPPIEILKNPWFYVDKDEIEIRPIVHELSLHKKRK